MTEKNNKREVVVPGEVIAQGDDFLPGDWVIKHGKDIVATRLGIVEKQDRLVKIIPLSGVYIPRAGNVVIGEVKDMVNAGWNVEIGGPYAAFLQLRGAWRGRYTCCRRFADRGVSLYFSGRHDHVPGRSRNSPV